MSRSPERCPRCGSPVRLTGWAGGPITTSCAGIAGVTGWIAEPCGWQRRETARLDATS